MSWVQNDGNQFGLPLQPAQSKQSQPSSVREDFPGLDDIAAVLRAASLPLYVTPRGRSSFRMNYDSSTVRLFPKHKALVFLTRGQAI